MKSNLSTSQPTQKSWLAKVLYSPTRLGVGLALAATALVLPACDNSNQANQPEAYSGQPQTEANADSATDPEQMVGQTVVVNGEVDEVYSPNAFSIDADNTFGANGEKVLVLVSTGAAGAGTGTGTGGSAMGSGTGSTGTSTGTDDTGAASTDTGMGTGTSGTGATTGTGTDTTSASTADLDEGETVQLTGEVQTFTPDALQSEYGITLDETLLSQLRQDYDGKPVIVTSSFDQLPAGASNGAPSTSSP